ncbi:MAG: AbrB/MazE/SpoVT family DNA-binding domain-containing protein [Nitrososphaeraceae archaeon]
MDNLEYSYRKVQGIVGENSFSIVLPKHYANNLGIRKGDHVKIVQVGKCLMIEKAEEE